MTEQQGAPGAATESAATESAAPAPLMGRPLGAREIAELLGLPSPTPEQVAVIEAPLSPALVVAGAGSGKTETMSNRIIWLLANGHVRVSEVLGLTFTRKAAGELAERVHERIAQLQTALAARDAEAADGASSVAPAPVIDPLDAPVISTYNAFASSLFREYAALIGREADAAVIGEASAWALARRVLVRSTDPRLVHSERSLPALIAGVLRVARALSDNDARGEADAIAEYAREFLTLEELPINDENTGNRRRSPQADLVKAVADLSELPLLLDLAAEYAEEKRRRGFIEFSDQVALALEICRRQPRAVREYRARYRVIILDEYQDTSVVQTELLSRLFAGQAVMAVGDPNQSIYGWRGASAANLARFSADFATDRVSPGAAAADATAPADAAATHGAVDVAPDAAPVASASAGGAARFTLSTSWRNHGRILDAANALVAPLPVAAGVPVTALLPSPFAGAGAVRLGFEETVRDEAEAAALWLKAELARPTGGGKPRSAALLCRSLKKVDPFTRALREHGVPYHVLGLAGLLDQPVIVDLVCALRVLHDPSAGSELVRLLSGARWRIGVRDLRALADLARWLGDRDHRLQPVTPEMREKRFASAAVEDSPSLVDALDFIETTPSGHGALSRFSPVGLERMRAAAAQFTALRRRAGLGLHDYVGLVSQELGLDLESAANENAALAQPSLEAFAEQITAFLSVDETGTIGPFLAWLEQAEQHENLSPRAEEPEPGTVQILTIHGSKGLEWDSVAIPRLVDGELPGPPKSKRGWTAFGEVPYDFRGDRHELPILRWRGVLSQPEFGEAFAAFGEGIEAQNAQEQRRLAYVAVTRARDALCLSGSFWATTTKPRPPGTFLHEVARAVPSALEQLPGGELPAEPANEENPLAEEQESILWPRDPLGERTVSVHAAAAAVEEADPARATPWDSDIALLLAERERAATAVELVEMPARVPASRYKDFVGNPAEVAARLARPLPERPYRQTRLGTLFHDWVEHRTGVYGGQETIDSDPFERDDEDAGGTLMPVAEEERLALDTLKATFEASEWGPLAPIETEIEINFVMNDQIMICKLDAVYRRGERYQVVDWKTGKAPRDDAELVQRQYQLALYREAYAQWTGIDPELIDAVFYYVADDRVIRPERLSDARELRETWEAALGG